MKAYRLDYQDSEGLKTFFEPSISAAKAHSKLIEEGGDEDLQDGVPIVEIEQVEIPTSKRELLEFLNSLNR